MLVSDEVDSKKISVTGDRGAFPNHKAVMSSRRHSRGRLGGSVGEASDFGSGHALTVREFEPHVELCADSSDPGACFRFCVSLPLCCFLACALSLLLSKNE